MLHSTTPDVKASSKCSLQITFITCKGTKYIVSSFKGSEIAIRVTVGELLTGNGAISDP